MALTAKNPSRRKSIATTNQNHKPDLIPRRKRAHSIAPGDLERLSPATKARRSLGPSKGILKPVQSLPNDAIEDNEGDQNEPSQDDTRAMSLSRRVSFAAHAYVRIFEKNQNNTNSTGSPQSSPRSDEIPRSNNENAWLGTRRHSQGSETFSDEDEPAMNDDMEITGALPTHFLRRRSQSLSGTATRQPLGIVSQELSTPSQEDISMSTDNSVSEADRTLLSPNAEDTEPLEYTVPLIKPRRQPSDAWLALRAVTHSGDQPLSESEGEDEMELDDAVGRLLAARPSIAFGSAPSHALDEQPSFTSTQDSVDEDEEMDDGNKTMNITAMMRRESAADSTMDLSRVYGGPLLTDEPIASIDTETKAPMQSPKASGSSIFSAVTRPFKFAFSSASQPETNTDKPPPAVPKSVFSVFSRPGTESTGAKALKIPANALPASEEDGATPMETMPSSRERSSSPSRLPVSLIRTIQPTSAPYSKEPGSSVPSHIPVPVRSNTVASTSKIPLPSGPAEAATPVSSLRRPSGYFTQRKSISNSATQAAAPLSSLSAIQSLAGLTTSATSNAPAKPISPQRTVVQPVTDILIDDDLTETTVASVAVKDTGTMGEAIENPTAQWRENVQQEEPGFIDDGNATSVSIEQFFDMTGIRFMEEITAPRRSTHQGRRQSTNGAEPSLSAYALAQVVSLPQLDLYSSVANDLELWIKTSEVNNKAIEADVAVCTPELFREFINANEEDQAELITQLHLIKANTHLAARSGWYDWRMAWVTQLQEAANASFADLEADCAVLKTVLEQQDALLPVLQTELDNITRELEEAQKLTEEIDECDPEYLRDLKTDLADQELQMIDLRSTLSKADDKLERDKEHMAELDLQKRDQNQMIEKLQQNLHFHKNSRSAEVFRMKDELEALERLHQWRFTRIQANAMQLSFSESFQVSLPCHKFRPVADGIAVERLKSSKTAFKDAFPVFTDVTMHMARYVILQSKESIATVPQIVQRLSRLWTACEALRRQMKFLQVKYPLEVHAASADGFRVTATVFFPKVEAKALISFIFDRQTVSTWPMSIASTSCEVIVKYGHVDGDAICNAIMDRLSEASPDSNHACLLDACVSAEELYAQID